MLRQGSFSRNFKKPFRKAIFRNTSGWILLNINDSALVCSEPSQNSKMKPFFLIKTSVAIEMFKTENHCKTPQVVDATDGTQHTRKRGLRTLKKTLKRTLSLRTLKRTLLLSILKRTLSLRTLKEPNQTLTPPCRL